MASGIKEEEIDLPKRLSRDEMHKSSVWSRTHRWSDAETILNAMSELSGKEKVSKMVSYNLRYSRYFFGSLYGGRYCFGSLENSLYF